MNMAAYPRRNENPLLPHPDPSMTVVKTHVGLCLFGVRMRRAIQIQIEAMTACRSVSVLARCSRHLLLIGANHKIMRWSQLVGKEHIVPKRQSTKIARSTV